MLRQIKILSKNDVPGLFPESYVFENYINESIKKIYENNYITNIQYGFSNLGLLETVAVEYINNGEILNDN